MKLIHERASEIDPSPRSSQERLRRVRIWERIQSEAFALVPDCKRDLVRGTGDPNDNLFLPVRLVAVNDGIVHNFADGETNLFQSSAMKSRPPCILKSVVFYGIDDL